MAKEFYVEIVARISIPVKVLAKNEEEAIELAEDYAYDGVMFEYSADSGSSLGVFDEMREYGLVEEPLFKTILADRNITQAEWQNSGKITIKRYEDERGCGRMENEIKKYVSDLLDQIVNNPNADFDEAWSRVSKEFRKGVGKPFLCGTFYDPRDNAFYGWNESIIEAMAEFFDEKNGEAICCTGQLELAEDIRNGEVNEFTGMYYLDF